MLKILSLNIECNRHLPVVLDFLARQDFDAIFLQEVFLHDLSTFEKKLSMQAIYAPLNYIEHEGVTHKLTVATLVRDPVLTKEITYYRGNPDSLLLIKHGEAEKMARALIEVVIKHGAERYRLLNTHFTWSPAASPSAIQQEDFPKLMELLAKYQDFVFCADLNTPRGKAFFSQLANKYIDNIPSAITTTIDKSLHRAGDLNIVVDCMFTAGNHRVCDVKVISGLSDHCGVAGTVYK